jgi:hypothetical protein
MGRREIPARVLVAAVLAAACTASPTSTPTDRAATLKELRDGIRPSVSVKSDVLVATIAFADPDVDLPPKPVRVRIVDRLDLEARVETAHDVSLASDPRFCLVGPYSAPNEGGLEDPCWGDPDLSALMLAQMPRDAAGHPMFRAGSPLTVATTIARGESRCDYAGGSWRLEVKLDVLFDGTASGAEYLPDTTFDVPFAHEGALPLVPTAQTRYCGLATLVVRDQGEPAVETPSPGSP